MEIEFPSVFTHSRQAEEAVKKTRFPIAMCFFHLSKADLGCTSTACVSYTPQKKRLCIALYGLWTHPTVLSSWETSFAFLSLYSIPTPVGLIGLGFVFFLKKHWIDDMVHFVNQFLIETYNTPSHINILYRHINTHNTQTYAMFQSSSSV